MRSPQSSGEQHLNINNITGKTRQLFPCFLQLNEELFSVDPSALPSWMDVIVRKPSPTKARCDTVNKGWFLAWCDELTPVPMWGLWSLSRCQLSVCMTFLGELWTLGSRPLNIDLQCMNYKVSWGEMSQFLFSLNFPTEEAYLLF